MSAPVRQHRRHRFVAECVVRRGERVLADRVLDVSADGLRVRALEAPALGDAVQVSLRVPGADVWLEAEGTVARLLEGRRAGEAERSFAIRLRRMDRTQRQLLRAVAGLYPEARGGRGESRDPRGALARAEEPGGDAP